MIVAMTRHNIFWCMAAVMLLASCTAMEMEPDFQNPEGESDKPKQTITINAVTVDDNADTRAIHGTEENQTSFSWQAGIDKIGVIKGADEYGDGELIWGMDHHRFTNTQDGQIATFVYDIDEEGAGLVWGDELTLSVGDQIVAYYPYATAASSWYDSTKPWLMSSHGALVQHGDNNTEHLFRGDYMFSKVITLNEGHFDSEGNVNLTIEFGHIFSKVRFSVKNSTAEPLDISSLIYRSTKEDDVMQGTLILDASTGEVSYEGLGDWGMVPPMNSAVLEVENVSIAPGETATLWMWMMPLDFTEGNPDGRTADIMVNTNKGVFRVADKTFASRFVPGQVYRQGLELTDDKLLEDYGYISDHNFARIIYEGDINNQYDEESGDWIGTSTVTLYDMNFHPYELTGEEDLYGEFALTSGSFIKLSEAAEVERIYVSPGQYNALSFDGLQYFTGLRSLEIELGMDMNVNLTMRALKVESLVNLEELIISTPMQIHTLDLSKNVNLMRVDLNTPRLEKLYGLGNLTKLEAFGMMEHNFDEDMLLDFKNCTDLKGLGVPDDVKVDVSGLTLDVLSVNDARNLISENLTCRRLENYMGYAFPSGAPKGVEYLSLWLAQEEGSASMFSQFADMPDIKTLDLSFNAGGSDYAFTSAQSSVTKLTIYQSSEPVSEVPCPTGWEHLTGVTDLSLNKDVYDYDDLWEFSDSSPLDLSGMTSLSNAVIKVKKLEAFSVPSSLKKLELSTKSAVTFTPTSIEDLSLSSNGKPITLGDAPALRKATLYAGAESGDGNAITLGACPKLKEFIVNADAGKLKLNGSSYPALTSFRISKGKNISSIPSASVFPALETLSIGGSGYGSRENGIGTLDATQYTKLTKLDIGGLDDGYSYRNYNNRYYDGYNYYVRAKGSFIISEAQYNAAKAYAKANPEREIFSGISGFENYVWDESSQTTVPAFQYKVNSIYKVVDSEGNEVAITDSDPSDGETTSIVTSRTN